MISGMPSPQLTPDSTPHHDGALDTTASPDPSASSSSDQPLSPPASSRPRLAASTSFPWTRRGNVGGGGGAASGDYSSNNETPTSTGEDADIVFSPSEEAQHYAQQMPLTPQTPSSAALRNSHQQPAKTSQEVQDAAALRAIRRFRLDQHDGSSDGGQDAAPSAASSALDAQLLHRLLPRAPRLTAAFVSCNSVHRVIQQAGNLDAHRLPANFVRSLTSAIAADQTRSCQRSGATTSSSSSSSSSGGGGDERATAITTTDLSAFLQKHSITRPDELPSDVTYLSAAVISLSPAPGRAPVPVGLVASFDQDDSTSSLLAHLIPRLADSIVHTFRANYLARRRRRELKAQEEIVKLTRLSNADVRRTTKSSGHGSDGEESETPGRKLFKEAARSVGRVLRARTVVVFDLSGFKFEKIRLTQQRTSDKSGGSDSDDDTSPDDTPRKPRRPDDVASVQASMDALELDSDDDGSTSADSAYGDAEASSQGSRAHRDSRSSVSRSLRRTSAAQPPRRPRPSRHWTVYDDSGDESDATRSILCSYTNSAKPVPLLARSGQDKSYFQKLSGDEARPVLAAFLASTRDPRRSRRRDYCGSSSSIWSQGGGDSRPSPLSPLLPHGCQGLCATPVFEANNQPAYLILSVFQDPPSECEESDCLFVEQVGSCIIAAALRLKSQAIDRAQVRLTQRMQHQLRTPLHTIVGICESANEVLKENEETRKSIAGIALSAEALDSSLNDIFDYAAMAGIKDPKIARAAMWPSTNFRGLFDIVCRTANASWRLHCLTKTSLDDDRLQVPPPPELSVTCGPGSWKDLPEKFQFDCESLTRVVSKLVTNGLQATSRGIVMVNLSVRPKSNQEPRPAEGLKVISDLHLTVADTGHGMSPEFLQTQVFRPFTRALDNSAGAGLSLSICSSIMSRLGGRVHVASTEGKGTTFDFTFPFRGKAAPSVQSTGVKVAAIPVDEDEKSRVSFLALCKQLCGQFGAIFTGNIDRNPELLDECSIVFVAGERSETREQRAACANSIVARNTTRRADQIIIEVPNRAFSDPPGSLQPDRKQVWLGELPAVQIFRPFVLPDLETMEEIFDDVLAQRPVHSDEFLEAAERTANANGKEEAASSANGSSATSAHHHSSSNDGESTTGDTIPQQPSQKPSAPNKSDRPSTARKPKKLFRRSSQQSIAPSTPGGHKRPFRCLVVEDNPLNARILVGLLRRVGVEPLEAKDGVEGVEMFRLHHPQVVLLDINMPRMNGFEAAIEMRRTPTEHYPRIIAVTALSLEADKLRGKECGIDDWLQKPVRLAQLASDVKSWRDEGVWANDVPRENREDSLDPPKAEDLQQHTIEA